MVDLGVENTPQSSSTVIKKINVPKGKSKSSNNSSLEIVEKEFIKLYVQNKIVAYKKYLSSGSILNRNGTLPAITLLNQKNIIDSTSSIIKYTIDNRGIAKSFDMGYVYGTATINDKTENYLRIWRKEKKGWKIALEILRY